MGGASRLPPDHQWPTGEEAPLEQREYLRGIVDMGSNGIRFSVSDLSPPTARIIPTVYVNRLDISLYDAQFDPDTGHRVPIPSAVIDSIIAALLRFQIICSEFDVLPQHIRVVATEATRTALNSAEFLEAIKKKTGLAVTLLAKEDEGRIGALGIASGFSDIQGLAIDLGGGSAQITWLISQGGNVRLSPEGSFSFPYGAAALTRKLATLTNGKEKHEAEKCLEEFREEMTENFKDAYQKMQLPEDMVERAKQEGGFPLYLSGGGFRGWGYLLLYISQQHNHHYPISIINGFSAPRDHFENVDAMKNAARHAHKIFRVSDRRREQVPAVAFLVNVLAKALPHGIRMAHFCQGGVREGVLFQELLPSIRNQDPLEVATLRYAPPSVNEIHNLILAAIPRPSGARKFPETINQHILRSFAQVLYVHARMSKESGSTTALYSTSTGIMSATHGVSHPHRALLALMLEERYEGELPPREVDFKESLRTIITSEEAWWTVYLGKVGLIISRLYPAGKVDERKPRVVLSTQWSNHLGKNKHKRGLDLTWSIQKKENDPMKMKEVLDSHLKVIRKAGKKKNWIGGENGWGMAVEVKVVEEDIL